MSVGEEAGAIDTLLVEVAEYYEREVDYDIKNLSSAIEPLLLLGILLVFTGVQLLTLGLLAELRPLVAR